MKVYVYSIKDTKLNFTSPIFYANDAVATRNLKLAVNGPKSPDNWLSNYPSDLELWRLGVYDDELGELFPEKKFLFRLSDLVDYSTDSESGQAE